MVLDCIRKQVLIWTYTVIKALLTTILIFGVSLFSSQIPASDGEYTFGIVPQQSASKLARLWGPILAEISNQSGVKLRFATAPDIPAFEARLAAGEYDFAYMNPYHYTVFSKSSGYHALAKAKDKKIKGILVVRKDTEIADMQSLADSQLAFPAPAAFAATILTQSHLEKSRVAYTPKYVSSHDSVYRTVAKGLYPAGGGVIRTLRNVAPEVRDQLKVFWISEGYTPHAFAASPAVDKSTRQTVKDALIALDTNERGRKLLGSIRLKGLEAALDSDWDDVRELSLKRLPQ